MEFEKELIIALLNGFVPCFSCFYSEEDSYCQITSILASFASKKSKKTGNTALLSKVDKRFLYKTYVSSSATESVKAIQFTSNVLEINAVSRESIESLLFILKDDVISDTPSCLLAKLEQCTEIRVKESKPFDFRYLSVLFNFVIPKFSKNIKNIYFEGCFTGKIDQVENIIKNCVILHFLSQMTGLQAVSVSSKFEAVNQNIFNKFVLDYLKERNTKFEVISLKNYSILSVLKEIRTLTSFKAKLVNIDKSTEFEHLTQIFQNNKLIEVEIDKILFIKGNDTIKLLKCTSDAGLRSLSIRIHTSESKEILQFCSLIGIKKVSLSVSEQLCSTETVVLAETVESLSVLIDCSPLESLKLHSNLQELRLGTLSECNLACLTGQFKTKAFLLKKIFIRINKVKERTFTKTAVSLLLDCTKLISLEFEGYALHSKKQEEKIISIVEALPKLRNLSVKRKLHISTQIIPGLSYFHCENPSFLKLLWLDKIKNKRRLTKSPVICKLLTTFMGKKREKQIHLDCLY